LLKQLIKWSARAYYRRIEVSGAENIPFDKPVIFAPPHQNAMMDGVVIITSQSLQPYILTRADVFNKPTVAKMLKAIRFIPIYRKRDNVDHRANNNPIFEFCAEKLKGLGALLIFPEADMHMKKRLRPVRKGLARIAFKAEAENNFELDVKVIPVGLDFSYYSRARSDVMVSFGKPLSIKDYQKIYEEHESKAIRVFTEDLAAKIHERMIHIKSDEDYELMIFMCKMLYDKKNLKHDIFTAQQKVVKVEQLKADKPQKYKQLMLLLSEYQNLLQQNNAKDWQVKTPLKSISNCLIEYFILLGLTPFWLWGEINNFFPNRIPFMVIPKLVGPQFKSSGIFLLSFFLFIIFYTLQTLTAYWLSGSPLFALMYFFTLAGSGFFAVKFREYWNRNTKNYQFASKTKKQPKILENLKNLRKEIMEVLG